MEFICGSLLRSWGWRLSLTKLKCLLGELLLVIGSFCCPKVDVLSSIWTLLTWTWLSACTFGSYKHGFNILLSSSGIAKWIFVVIEYNKFISIKVLYFHHYCRMRFYAWQSSRIKRKVGSRMVILYEFEGGDFEFYW